MDSQSTGQPSSVPGRTSTPAKPGQPGNPTHADDPARRRKRHWWVWVLVIGAFCLIFYLVLRHRDDPTQAAAAGARRALNAGPVTLNVAQAKKGDIGVYLNAIGTVTPVYTSTITSQVNGVIVAVHYKEAQLVQTGDPLVDIDPRPYQATVTQAEGTLERDTNILGQSRMDLERYRAAWARNAIAKQTLDDQEKIVLQNEGTVKNDQGTLDYDKVQLAYCHITAPFNGRVGLRLIDPGNVVQSSTATPLVVITQMQPITVIFTIAEDYLGEIQAQLSKHVPMTVEAYDRALLTKIATGKLLALDNQIDTTTGTVRLRAQFDNKKYELFPNQFVNTRLLVNTQQGVTLIPTSAIQHNGNTAFVYKVTADNTAHLTTVKPGTEDAGNTAVTGVNPGDNVANSSFEKLQDNAKVKIVTTPVPASTNSESNAP
jgi:membrane fusion protein, multidrug efflux system